MGPHVAGIRTALPSPFTLPLFQAPISDHSLWSLTSNIPFLPFILRWWSYFLFHWKHRERTSTCSHTYIHSLLACMPYSVLPSNHRRWKTHFTCTKEREPWILERQIPAEHTESFLLLIPLFQSCREDSSYLPTLAYGTEGLLLYPHSNKFIWINVKSRHIIFLDLFIFSHIQISGKIRA